MGTPVCNQGQADDLRASADFDHRRIWGPRPRYPAVKGVRRPNIWEQKIHEPLVIAGPCSIESPEQIEACVGALKGHHHITFMRGGVYRAGTYPPAADFGLRKGLLRRWASAAHKAGLKIIVEVLDVRQIEYLDQYADAFQVGARQMQHYALLQELSQSSKVVTLKRNPGSTLDEFLGAAEYLARGRCRPVLIERGGSTLMNHVRWDLSISLIAAVKKITKIPIIVDASHGTGRRDLVEPMTLAGVAAGADGYLVEVHPDPQNSLSDSDQAFDIGDLRTLMRRARNIWANVQSFREADAYL